MDLALANVGGVFFVLGIGVGIAVVLAIFEFLWNVRSVSVEEHVSIRVILFIVIVIISD